MANLETLFIEINGNAEKATGSIDGLINSISNLGKVVSSNVGALKEFSKALKQISNVSVGGNAFKNISAATGSNLAKATKTASKYAEGMREVSSETQKAAKEISNAEINPFGGKRAETYLAMNRMDLMQEKLDNMKTAFIDNAKAGKYTEEQLAANALKIQNYEAQVNKAKASTEQFKEAQKETAKASGEMAKTVHKSTSAFTSLLKTIGRLAKMMLIRMAIKALIKVAKQGLQNYYEYSKSINGGFYNATKEIQSSMAQTGNQLGAMLGTLITAITPLLMNLLQIVNAVAEGLTMLFALLSGSTTYTRAVATGIDDVGSSAKSAGGAMKELLASFDELNVIASKSGGGGGGSDSGMFGGAFEEVPLPDWMLENKDLIEAGLIGLGITALIGKLAKLWDWLKKIKDLTSGTNSIRWPTQPDYKPFPTQPAYQPFPTQPTYTEFPMARDYSAMALEMAGIAGSLSAAATAAELLAAAMEKVGKALTAISIATGLISTLSSLLSSLANSIKITPKVDKKEFEKFKKELDKYCKEKKEIKIDVKIDDRTKYDDLKKELKEWIDQGSTKTINIAVNMTEYLNAYNTLNTWCLSELKKRLAVKVNTDEYYQAYDMLNQWCMSALKKRIVVAIDLSEYYHAYDMLNTWCTNALKKRIVINVDITEYYLAYNILNIWCLSALKKRINLEITNLASTLTILANLDAWGNQVINKHINIVFTTSTKEKKNIMSAISEASGVGVVGGTVGTIGSTVNVSQSEVNKKAKTAMEVALGAALDSINIDSMNKQSVYSEMGTYAMTNPILGDYSVNINRDTIPLFENLSYMLSNVASGLQDPYGTFMQSLFDMLGYADGAYGIPSGDLFIANEAGAELVGSMNGRTTVANQEQIIEGIRRGVADGQAEQNTLLRQQNELLRGILNKDSSVRVGASVALGRVAKQSLDMYSTAIGG